MPDPKKPQKPKPVAQKKPAEPPADEPMRPVKEPKAWNRLSTIFLAAAAALALMSAIILFIGVKRIIVRSSINAALFDYDSNRRERVVSECASALGWDGGQDGLRLLEAKIKVEKNDLDGAERDYNDCAAKGTAVHVGLGIVSLRRADRETDLQKVSGLVDKAIQSFSNAKGTVESEVATGVALLLLARKTNNTAKLSEAIAAFKRAEGMLNRRDIAARTAKETLLDFYAGYARALSLQPGGDLRLAGRCYKVCEQYEPRWQTSGANRLRLEAQRYIKGGESEQAEFNDHKEQVRAAIDEIQLKWSTNPVQYGELKEPWAHYTMAVASLFATSGDLGTFDNLMQTAAGQFQGRFDIKMTRAAVWTKVFVPSKIIDQKYVNGAFRISIEDLLGEPYVNEHADLRAVLQNNAGACWEYISAMNNKDYEDAVTRFMQALKDNPTMYSANRNLAVIFQRFVNNKKEKFRLRDGTEVETAKKAAEFFSAAEKAASTEANQKDLAQVRAFMRK